MYIKLISRLTHTHTHTHTQLQSHTLACRPDGNLSEASGCTSLDVLGRSRFCGAVPVGEALGVLVYHFSPLPVSLQHLKRKRKPEMTLVRQRGQAYTGPSVSP